MVASVFSFLSALLISSRLVQAADETCREYVPRGHTSNLGRLQFTGHGSLSYIPTINALAGYPVVLDPKHKAGTVFHFQSCNSSYNAAYPYQQRYCTKGEGCDVIWNDNVRVIHPTTGNCLTSHGLDYPTSNLIFSKCNTSAPNDGSQLFSTVQDVHYPGPNYTGTPVYGQVHFIPYGMDTNYDDSDPTAAWVIGSDNRTILWPVPEYGISGDSLLGVLVPEK